MTVPPRVLVLGASGLIGHSAATALRQAGYRVTAAARSFAPGQRVDTEIDFVAAPLVGIGADGLADLIERSAPDVVVNAVGALGDAPGATADAVHGGFVADCLAALAARPGTLLVHISVPGAAADDRTRFSRTKRAADTDLARSGHPYLVLRPGFVFAANAYGGSALLRMVAASPFDLPPADRARPFRAVDMADLAATLVHVCRSWCERGEPNAAVWDVMSPEETTLGDVIDQLRGWLGTSAWLRLPAPLLGLGARAGDLAVRLGWRPPVRTAALAEMRRGVTGDPAAWIAATGIAPRPLREVLAARPAGVADRWFARLYGLKPLMLATLSLFFMVSGLIVLGPAYEAGRTILAEHGFGTALSHAATVLTALADIAIGMAIAHRRTCRLGLLSGLGITFAYLASATVLAPELWLDPVGALVKTIPIAVLMLIALATLDAR